MLPTLPYSFETVVRFMQLHSPLLPTTNHLTPRPATRCKSCATTSMGVDDSHFTVVPPPQLNKIPSYVYEQTISDSTSVRFRASSCLYHLVLFVFRSPLMSHFNHPCITTPHASPPFHILTFILLPSSPTPCVPYITICTFTAVHLFSLSPFSRPRPLLHYTYPLLAPRILYLLPALLAVFLSIESYRERGLLYPSIMLLKILPLPNIKYPWRISLLSDQIVLDFRVV